MAYSGGGQLPPGISTIDQTLRRDEKVRRLRARWPRLKNLVGDSRELADAHGKNYLFGSSNATDVLIFVSERTEHLKQLIRSIQSELKALGWTEEVYGTTLKVLREDIDNLQSEVTDTVPLDSQFADDIAARILDRAASWQILPLLKQLIQDDDQDVVYSSLRNKFNSLEDDLLSVKSTATALMAGFGHRMMKKYQEHINAKLDQFADGLTTQIRQAYFEIFDETSANVEKMWVAMGLLRETLLTLERVDQEITTWTNAYNDEARKLAEKIAEFDRLKQDKEAAEASINSLEQNLETAERERDEYKQNHEAKTTEFNQLAEAKQLIDTSNTELAAKLQAVEAERDNCKQQLEQKSQAFDNEHEKVAEMSSKLAKVCSAFRGRFESVHTHAAEIEARRRQIGAHRQSLVTALATSDASFQAAQSQASRVQTDMGSKLAKVRAAFRGRFSSAHSHAAEIEARRQQIGHQRRYLTTTLATSEANAQAAQRQASQLQTDLSQKIANLESSLGAEQQARAAAEESASNNHRELEQARKDNEMLRASLATETEVRQAATEQVKLLKQNLSTETEAKQAATEQIELLKQNLSTETEAKTRADGQVELFKQDLGEETEAKRTAEETLKEIRETLLDTQAALITSNQQLTTLQNTLAARDPFLNAAFDSNGIRAPFAWVSFLSEPRELDVTKPIAVLNEHNSDLPASHAVYMNVVPENRLLVYVSTVPNSVQVLINIVDRTATACVGSGSGIKLEVKGLINDVVLSSSIGRLAVLNFAKMHRRGL